jgi:hypothetical protein
MAETSQRTKSRGLVQRLLQSLHRKAVASRNEGTAPCRRRRLHFPNKPGIGARPDLTALRRQTANLFHLNLENVPNVPNVPNDPNDSNDPNDPIGASP